MPLFLGLDSSTQSLTATVIDLDAGSVVTEFSLNFGRDFPEFNSPNGFLPDQNPLVCHSDPLLWCAALDRLCAQLPAHGIRPAEIAGISGSGQQHGSVYLDAAFARHGLQADPAAGLAAAVKPHLTRRLAPIWMDSSTTAECLEITAAAGGTDEVRRRSGSAAIERFTGPQIRKFFKTEPDAYARTGVIHLVSSFLCSLLTGRSAPVDPGDGAGMNLLNLARGAWDETLLAATAPDLAAKLPAPITGPAKAGEVSAYFVGKYGFRPGTPVIVWSGDNPSSLVGVGAAVPGTAVVSLGTSHTFFAAMPKPVVDPAGYGHVFGNPAGGFMSLICFKNGALALDAARTGFGLGWAQVEELLRGTPPGNNGNLLLPYFVPEITPLVLHPGVIREGAPGFMAGTDAAAVLRGVAEAQALRLRLHSAWMGVASTALRVTGGAAANRAFCQILADVFDARVERLAAGNSAALGAALRAAQAVTGCAWEGLSSTFCKPEPGSAVQPDPAAVAVHRAQLPRYAALAARHAS